MIYEKPLFHDVLPCAISVPCERGFGESLSKSKCP